MPSRGFTLIELVVAMAIVLLLAGIAGPAVWRSLNSFRQHGEHGRLMTQLGELSFRAFRRGQPLVLSAETVAEHLGPLPEGWSVQPIQPIVFDFLGRCSGGTLRVQSAADAPAQTIRLSPGTCALEAERRQ